MPVRPATVATYRVAPSIPSSGECRLAFGFALDSDADLRVELPATQGPPDLQLDVRTVAELRPPSDTLVYSSEPARGSGAGVTTYRTRDGAILRFRGVDEFRIGADAIECDLLSRTYDYLIPIQFLGSVMALWMELRGMPVLHASAVVVEDRAVAFLAVKGGGKTTLAAGMVKAGHAMHSDDLVVIDRAQDDVLTRPSYPQFRMEPDVASHFIEGWDALPLVHPDHQKRRVPAGLLGEFNAAPIPLDRIYLPERIDRGEVAITPISGAQTLIELLRNSFLPSMVSGMGLEPGRLPTLGAVARPGTIKHLRYPSGLGRLPEVVAAIEDDLDSRRSN